MTVEFNIEGNPLIRKHGFAGNSEARFPEREATRAVISAVKY